MYLQIPPSVSCCSRSPEDVTANLLSTLIAASQLWYPDRRTLQRGGAVANQVPSRWLGVLSNFFANHGVAPTVCAVRRGVNKEKLPP